MSSFWTTSTGEDLSKQTAEESTAYTPPENSMDPIPGGSKVRAFIKEASWDSPQGSTARFIKLRWDVTKPDEYAKRVVFHKLWALDPDPQAKNPDEKTDKAKRLFRKIDALAGGKIAAKGAMPTDDELLVALANKEMVLSLELWEMTGNDGSEMSGNWVRDVHPCEGTAISIGDKLPKGDGGGAGSGSSSADNIKRDNSDIPF